MLLPTDWAALLTGVSPQKHQNQVYLIVPGESRWLDFTTHFLSFRDRDSYGLKPQMPYVTKDDLELILQPLPSKCWGWWACTTMPSLCETRNQIQGFVHARQAL